MVQVTPAGSLVQIMRFHSALPMHHIQRIDEVHVALLLALVSQSLVAFLLTKLLIA